VHDDTEATEEPKEEGEEQTGSEDAVAEEETSEEPSPAEPEPKKTEKKAPSSDPLNPILYYSVVSQPKPQKEEAKAEPTSQEEEEEGEEEPKAEVDSTVSSDTTSEEPVTASVSEDSAEEPKNKAPGSDPQNPLLYYSVVSQPKPHQKEKAKAEPTVQEEEEPKAEVDSTVSSSTVSEEPAKASVSEDSTVTFEWRHGGSEVLVAGSFNGWTDKISLESNGEGVFSKTLELPPGDFEFKFVVDGDWKLNPDLPTQTNASGITNNVVHVSSSGSSVPSFQPLAQENGQAEDARWHPLAERQASILDSLKALERRVDLIAGQV